MFVINVDSLKDIVKVNKNVGEYLIKNKIPLLSIEKEFYIFANTEEVNNLVKYYNSQ